MPDVFVSKPKDHHKKESHKELETKKEHSSSLAHEPLVDAEKQALPAPHLKPPKKPTNPLSAFVFYPRKVNFVTKDPQETVILVVRKHPITQIKWILASILMVSLPLIVNATPITQFVSYKFYIIGILGWYLISLAFIFENFLTWFFNVNIITDERVIDVDFINLVYREITDADIQNIQDVTVTIGSVIRTLFNYGNVQIQTAAEIPEIEFEAIPQPDRVAAILRELRLQEEQEKLEGRIR